MALTMDIAPKWLGKYPIADTAHADDLEMRAAINEHHYGMSRGQAEEKAHADYRHDQIVESAAHHLTGMKAANAAGNLESAKKHGSMYQFALKALKHDDLVTPPEEVTSAAKNTPSVKIARFKAHPSDLFSLPQEPKDGESPGPGASGYRNEKQVKEGKK